MIQPRPKQEANWGWAGCSPWGSVCRSEHSCSQARVWTHCSHLMSPFEMQPLLPATCL